MFYAKSPLSTGFALSIPLCATQERSHPAWVIGGGSPGRKPRSPRGRRGNWKGSKDPISAGRRWNGIDGARVPRKRLRRGFPEQGWQEAPEEMIFPPRKSRWSSDRLDGAKRSSQEGPRNERRWRRSQDQGPVRRRQTMHCPSGECGENWTRTAGARLDPARVREERRRSRQEDRTSREDRDERRGKGSRRGSAAVRRRDA